MNEASSQNAGRLVTAIGEFGFDVELLSPELFLKEDSIVRFGRPQMRIEVLTSISGANFANCYRACVHAVIDDAVLSSSR